MPTLEDEMLASEKHRQSLNNLLERVPQEQRVGMRQAAKYLNGLVNKDQARIFKAIHDKSYAEETARIDRKKARDAKRALRRGT